MFKIFISFLITCSLVLHCATLNANSVYVVKDPEIEDFIRELLNPILKIAQIKEDTINIYILSDNTINAFVYGGKNIFVNTGLISAANGSDEIAGVLAHELGHITAGHLSRGDIAYSKANIFILLGLAALILSAPFSGNNNNISDLVGFLSYSALQTTQGAILSYSRSEESQADQIALEYIKESQFSLKGFYSFMEKLYKKEDKNIYKLPTFALKTTHPLTLNRMVAIDEYIKNNPQKVIINKDLEEKLLRVQGKISIYTSSNNNIKLQVKEQNNSDIYLYKMAMIEHINSKFSSSLNYLQKLLQKHPNDPYYLELSGDNHHNMGNYDLTIVSYKSIKKNKSNNNIIYYKIAKNYFLKEDYKQALSNIDLSLQITPENPSGWQLKALILGKLQKYPQADLALAEQYFILHDYQRAAIFANKALGFLDKESIDYIKATDLILAIKQIKT